MTHAINESFHLVFEALDVVILNFSNWILANIGVRLLEINKKKENEGSTLPPKQHVQKILTEDDEKEERRKRRRRRRRRRVPSSSSSSSSSHFFFFSTTPYSNGRRRRRRREEEESDDDFSLPNRRPDYTDSLSSDELSRLSLSDGRICNENHPKIFNKKPRRRRRRGRVSRRDSNSLVEHRGIRGHETTDKSQESGKGLSTEVTDLNGDTICHGPQLPLENTGKMPQSPSVWCKQNRRDARRSTDPTATCPNGVGRDGLRETSSLTSQMEGSCHGPLEKSTEPTPPPPPPAMSQMEDSLLPPPTSYSLPSSPESLPPPPPLENSPPPPPPPFLPSEESQSPPPFLPPENAPPFPPPPPPPPPPPENPLIISRKSLNDNDDGVAVSPPPPPALFSMRDVCDQINQKQFNLKPLKRTEKEIDERKKESNIFSELKHKISDRRSFIMSSDDDKDDDGGEWTE